MTPTRLNELLNKDNNGGQTLAPVLKAALVEKKRREDLANQELAIIRLDTADANTQKYVGKLREIRKLESAMRALVSTLGDSEEAYKQTGDWDKYLVAAEAARVTYNNAVRGINIGLGGM